MIELVVCGRGGQGTMTAAQLLAQALVLEGKFVQAFPSFYPEKRGAPFSSFVRYSRDEILLRCEIYHPKYLIVLDTTLLFANGWGYKVKPTTHVIANVHGADDLSGRFQPNQVTAIDASQIALHHKLGTRLNPEVSILILGAFARASGQLGLRSLEDALELSELSQKSDHLMALREAYGTTSAGALV